MKKILSNITNYLKNSKNCVIILFNNRANFILMMEYALFLGGIYMKQEKLKLIQDNYGWVLAIVTGLGVFFSFCLKFLNYLYSKIEFSYYGLDYGMYVTEDIGIIFNFCLTILFALCFYSLCYCYYQIFKMIKNKKCEVKLLLENIILILLSNGYIIFSSGIKISLLQAVIELFILFVLEFIMTIVVCKRINKEVKETDDTNEFLNYLKKLPFVVLLLIFLFLLSHTFSFVNNKEFRIIDDNKVIVYTTKEYYLLLDCEITEKKIKIYKGTQTKIDNINVESKLINFKKVNIIDN